MAVTVLSESLTELQRAATTTDEDVCFQCVWTVLLRVQCFATVLLLFFFFLAWLVFSHTRTVANQTWMKRKRLQLSQPIDFCFTYASCQSPSHLHTKPYFHAQHCHRIEEAGSIHLNSEQAVVGSTQRPLQIIDWTFVLCASSFTVQPKMKMQLQQSHRISPWGHLKKYFLVFLTCRTYTRLHNAVFLYEETFGRQNK